METTKCHCTNCGADMDQNAAFCVKCGVSKGKSKKFCGNCGVAVNEEQDFCIECGTKLSGKLDLSKGKESLQKFTKTAVEGTNDLAKAASKKTSDLAKVASEKTNGKVKPLWLAIGLGAIALIAVIGVSIFLLMPKGLSGTYSYNKVLDTSTSWLTGEETEYSIKVSYTFEGETFKAKFESLENGEVVETQEEKGIYRISENEITFMEEGTENEETAELSDDRKSISIAEIEDFDVILTKE